LKRFGFLDVGQKGKKTPSKGIQAYEKECTTKDGDMSCVYYDACDACVSHFVHGARPIKHWQCWLDQWQGYKIPKSQRSRPPVEAGSRVKIVGSQADVSNPFDPKSDGKTGVVVKKVQHPHVKFEVQLDGSKEYKSFDEKNLLAVGLEVHETVKIVKGEFKGKVGHVVGAVPNNKELYTISVATGTDKKHAHRKWVNITSENMAVRPTEDNFCGDVRELDTNEVLVDFSAANLNDPAYHMGGISRLGAAFHSVNGYLWHRMQKIVPTQIKKWTLDIDYHFLTPFKWKKYPLDPERPTTADFTKYHD